MVWGIRGVGSDGKIGMGWGSWGVDMVGYVCGWNWNNKLLFYLFGCEVGDVNEI